jgi:hypothetical protein
MPRLRSGTAGTPPTLTWYGLRCTASVPSAGQDRSSSGVHCFLGSPGLISGSAGTQRDDMLQRGTVLIVGLLLSTAAGCGSAERAAAPAATDTPRATPTPTPTETPPKAARSLRDCAQLWNADVLAPESSQVSANEFVAELAPVRVRVAYRRGDCFVIAPIGSRRIAIFTAAEGHRPFTIPERRRLKSSEHVDYNARAARDGRVTLG